MPVKDKVKIYWSTASEENAKEFIIERTSNARDFVEIGRVKASGNSTVTINYKGYDDNPLQGNNFYRLKQVDFNGEFTYTKLVSAKYLSSVAEVSIVPNPAKDKAIINFHASGNYPALIRVSDMQGNTILNHHYFTEEGMNDYLLDMSKLSKGIYTIQLIADDMNIISKLVKE
jgi:DUF971 family protein